jgi:hypothetical protein
MKVVGVATVSTMLSGRVIAVAVLLRALVRIQRLPPVPPIAQPRISPLHKLEQH